MPTMTRARVTTNPNATDVGKHHGQRQPDRVTSRSGPGLPDGANRRLAVFSRTRAKGPCRNRFRESGSEHRESSLKKWSAHRNALVVPALRTRPVAAHCAHETR